MLMMMMNKLPSTLRTVQIQCHRFVCTKETWTFYMIMLQKLGREMDEIGSALSAITRDVSVFPSQILSHLRSKSLPARSAYTKTVLQQWQPFDANWRTNLWKFSSYETRDHDLCRSIKRQMMQNGTSMLVSIAPPPQKTAHVAYVGPFPGEVIC